MSTASSRSVVTVVAAESGTVTTLSELARLIDGLPAAALKA